MATETIKFNTVGELYEAFEKLEEYYGADRYRGANKKIYNIFNALYNLMFFEKDIIFDSRVNEAYKAISEAWKSEIIDCETRILIFSLVDYMIGKKDERYRFTGDEAYCMSLEEKKILTTLERLADHEPCWKTITLDCNTGECEDIFIDEGMLFLDINMLIREIKRHYDYTLGRDATYNLINKLKENGIIKTIFKYDAGVICIIPDFKFKYQRDKSNMEDDKNIPEDGKTDESDSCVKDDSDNDYDELVTYEDIVFEMLKDMCNHETNNIPIGLKKESKTREISKGMVHTSYAKMVNQYDEKYKKIFNISLDENKVRNALLELEEQGQITKETIEKGQSRGTIITIPNYETLLN